MKQLSPLMKQALKRAATTGRVHDFVVMKGSGGMRKSFVPQKTAEALVSRGLFKKVDEVPTLPDSKITYNVYQLTDDGILASWDA